MRLCPFACLLAFLCSFSAFAQTPVTRIQPLGDSITFGSGAAGGYRNRLYQLLTASGYNVDFVGTQTSNGVATLPDSDHEGHSGYRIDQIDSGYAGYLAPIAAPDVVLLHIGTNDFGQNVNTTTAIDRWDALITKITNAVPGVQVVATNLMERNEPYNARIIQQFNPFVQGKIAAQVAAGRKVTFLDMRSFVPVAEMPDQLHPGQVGYNHMADAFYLGVMAAITPKHDLTGPAIARVQANTDLTHVVVTYDKPVADSAANLTNYNIGGLTVTAATLDAPKLAVTLTTSPQSVKTVYTLTVNNVSNRLTANPQSIAADTVATFSTVPRGYLNNIAESADYTLAYTLDVPTAPNYLTSEPAYTRDNRNGIGPFSRVAYYVELQTATGDLRYLWASMDAFTPDINQVAVPTAASGAVFQRSVTGMNVVSNAPAVVNGAGLTGNLEFWPTDATPANASAVSGASDGSFDFGDTRSASGNYGSMQLHNAAAGQTLFAFNNWGGAGGNADLGIGNNPAPVSGGVDWTFTHNAGSYTVKSIQVLVRTADDATPPALLSATTNYLRNTVTLTFSEPLAAASIRPENFTIPGVVVLSATLAANKHDVVLTTTALPIGVSLTVRANGVRDNSASANLMPAGASAAIAEPALPPEVATNVGAAAANYQLVYTANLPATGAFTSLGAAAYQSDNRLATGAYTRVAYYLELQKAGQPAQYVWVAMDPFTYNRAKLGIPTSTSGAVYQRNLANLEVLSNVDGVVTGSNLTGGNIEFWADNYTAPNGLPVTGASDATSDFGDTRVAAAGGGYGCMQIHNHDAGQTIFAINHFGTDGNLLDVGIGNQPTGDPDWTGAANAASYTRRVLHVLVLPGTNVPADVLAKIPEAAGWQLAASLAIPATGNMNSTGLPVYSVDNRSELGAFSRIAYYLELKKPTLAASYIWTAMDAFTTDPRKVAVPTTALGSAFQQKVTNLSVASNVGGIVTGTGLTGNIEFFSSNYSQAPTDTTLGASSTTYDFGDSLGTAVSGHGSMQVHNYVAKQTLFAINNWGTTNNTTNVLALGIGNNPAPTNNGVDWTFAANGSSYETRTLHVFVLPGSSDRVNPTITSAKGSSTLDRLIVTFSEPLADTSAALSNFSINGLAVQSAAFLGGTQQVVLTTSPQTAGAAYTVTVSGVRDRAGNLITQNSTAGFTALTPPAILANVAETAGYRLVYQLALPASNARWNTQTIPYSVDETKFGEQGFDRVAYLLELNGNWAYASFDAVTNAIGKIGIPTLTLWPAAVQQKLTNLNVASNVAGIVTGTNLTGGNIEFWGGNYSAANALNITGASATFFDFGDTMTTGTYGSLQIHNAEAAQTIFAYNNWGAATGANDFGIGNNPAGGSPTSVNPQLDWTFANNGASFTTRNLYVLVRPAPLMTGAAPELLSQPVARTLTVGDHTTLAVSVNGAGPFTYQWRRNGVAIAGATNPWLDLSDLTTDQAGQYDVIVISSGGMATTSQAATLSVVLPNRLPVFAGFRFATSVNLPALVTLNSLLSKATDADGDPLSLSLPNGASQQGGTLALDGSGLTYTPPAGFAGSDLFSLKISDGRGGQTTSDVAVRVTTVPLDRPILSGIASRTAGGVDTIFRGTPGVSYQLERSTELTGWAILQTAVAGDDGLLPFTDANPPVDKAFYRITPVAP